LPVLVAHLTGWLQEFAVDLKIKEGAASEAESDADSE
jgi:hypothetical protein